MHSQTLALREHFTMPAMHNKRRIALLAQSAKRATVAQGVKTLGRQTARKAIIVPWERSGRRSGHVLLGATHQLSISPAQLSAVFAHQDGIVRAACPQLEVQMMQPASAHKATIAHPKQARRNNFRAPLELSPLTQACLIAINAKLATADIIARKPQSRLFRVRPAHILRSKGRARQRALRVRRARFAPVQLFYRLSVLLGNFRGPGLIVVPRVLPANSATSTVRRLIP